MERKVNANQKKSDYVSDQRSRYISRRDLYIARNEKGAGVQSKKAINQDVDSNVAADTVHTQTGIVTSVSQAPKHNHSHGEDGIETRLSETNSPSRSRS